MSPLIVILTFSVIIAAVIAWDIWLALDKTPRNTISQAVHDLDRRYPVVRMLVGFVFGLLLGHFFWPV